MITITRPTTRTRPVESTIDRACLACIVLGATLAALAQLWS